LPVLFVKKTPGISPKIALKGIFSLYFVGRLTFDYCIVQFKIPALQDYKTT